MSTNERFSNMRENRSCAVCTASACVCQARPGCCPYRDGCRPVDGDTRRGFDHARLSVRTDGVHRVLDDNLRDSADRREEADSRDLAGGQGFLLDDDIVTDSTDDEKSVADNPINEPSFGISLPASNPRNVGRRPPIVMRPAIFGDDLERAVRNMEQFELHVRNMAILAANRRQRPEPIPPIQQIVPEEVCGICHEAMVEGVLRYNCNHRFHSECVQQWLARGGSCPLCRAFPLQGVQVEGVVAAAPEPPAVQVEEGGNVGVLHYPIAAPPRAPFAAPHFIAPERRVVTVGFEVVACPQLDFLGLYNSDLLNEESFANFHFGMFVNTGRTIEVALPMGLHVHVESWWEGRAPSFDNYVLSVAYVRRVCATMMLTPVQERDAIRYVPLVALISIQRAREQVIRIARGWYFNRIGHREWSILYNVQMLLRRELFFAGEIAWIEAVRNWCIIAFPILAALVALWFNGVN